jgi:hypothetical protein
MVTLMTVGYGDMVPEVPLAKVVESMAMVVAVIIMACRFPSLGGLHGALGGVQAAGRARRLERRTRNVIGDAGTSWTAS